MTPANAQDAQLRTQLLVLTRDLRKVHKALVDAETKRFGAVVNPLEHLQLVTSHPHFAWLQQLSGLMVELDERLDDATPIDEALASNFRIALEQLIGPGKDTQPEFRRRYLELLHDTPELTIAHGNLRRVLNDLPVNKAASAP